MRCEMEKNEAHLQELVNKGDQTSYPRDFREWEHRDLSELFWFHIGHYTKNPNEHSLRIMERAFLWAVHDNNGLANSFLHAFKWVTGGKSFYDESVFRGWER